MPYLCWSYAPQAYGLVDLSADRPTLWSVLFADPLSVIAGVIGGTLVGVLVAWYLTGRNERRYLTVTCGSRDHLHLPRRTAGGQRVYVCGPPRHSTCGDDSHPHVHAMTTAGDAVFVCVTENVDHRFRQASILHDLHNRREPTP